MKIGRLNLFYVGVFAWVLMFYFLAAGVHDWKLWTVAVVAFAERIVVQFAIYLMSRVTKTLARKLTGAQNESFGI